MCIFNIINMYYNLKINNISIKIIKKKFFNFYINELDIICLKINNTPRSKYSVNREI